MKPINNLGFAFFGTILTAVLIAIVSLIIDLIRWLITIIPKINDEWRLTIGVGLVIFLGWYVWLTFDEYKFIPRLATYTKIRIERAIDVRRRRLGHIGFRDAVKRGRVRDFEDETREVVK